MWCGGMCGMCRVDRRIYAVGSKMHLRGGTLRPPQTPMLLVRMVTVISTAALSSLPMVGQGRVLQGIVVDSAGSPIPYANIVASDSRRRVVTNERGEFRLSVASGGSRQFEIRRIGYHPHTLTLTAWPDTALRVVLVAATRSLDAITVAVERSRALAMHGFYERMTDVDKGINNGFFITPEEIEGRPGARFTDFLQGHAAVRVSLVSEGPFGQGRKGWQPQGVDKCRMEIYLDGVRFYPLTGANSSFINDYVQSNEIAGIEVYPRSVTSPPKYQSLNSRCGVILIWTK